MVEHAEKQREVQRLLGRYMLRVQQLEQLMRNMLSLYDVGGAYATFHADRARRERKLAKANFGDLVDEMFGSYIVADLESTDNAGKKLPKRAKRRHDAVQMPENQLAFRTTVRLPLPPEDFIAAHKAMLKVVETRNLLSHHFIRRFNVMSLQGCTDAAAYLVAAYEVLDGQLLGMHQMAKVLDESRREATAQLQSPEFEDELLNGIKPDGTIDWPRAGIVAAMREAAAALSVSGWTSLDDTIAYIAKHHPEQTPEKYKCGSWEEVFEKSGLFNLTQMTVDEAERRGLRRLDAKAEDAKGTG